MTEGFEKEKQQSDLSNILQYIEFFNRELNSDAMLANMGEYARSKNKPDPITIEEMQDVERFLVGEEFKRLRVDDALVRTGLSLRTIVDGRYTRDLSKEGLHSMELHVWLSHPEKFLQYLQEFSAEDASKEIEDLQKIAIFLVREIKYDSESRSLRNQADIEPLLRSIVSISQEYARLGVPSAFNEYVLPAQENYMNEFAMAKSLGLHEAFDEEKTLDIYDTFGGFNAFLQRRLNELLNALSIMYENPRARGLFLSALKTVQHTLQVAITLADSWTPDSGLDMVKKMGFPNYPFSTKERSLAILRSVEVRLQEFELSE